MQTSGGTALIEAPSRAREATVASSAAAPTAAADHTARGVGVVGLAGIALIHVIDSSGKLSEAQYMFWLSMALIAGTLGAAAMLLRRDARLAWAAAAAMSGATIVAYVLSRTTGLPGFAGDIGNWAEPIGTASLFVESGVFLLAAHRWWALRAPATDRHRSP